MKMKEFAPEGVLAPAPKDPPMTEPQSEGSVELAGG